MPAAMRDTLQEPAPGEPSPAGFRGPFIRGLWAGLFLFTGIVGVPALISLGTGVPFPLILAVAGSALVIEYAAVVPGVALQLPAYITVLVVLSVGSGVITGSLEIFDAFSLTSPRLSRFLSRVRMRTAGKFLHRYGIWGLAPAILVAGFYVTPGLSFILGMPKKRSIAIMTGAFLLGELVTLSIATGVLKLL